MDGHFNLTVIGHFDYFSILFDIFNYLESDVDKIKKKIKKKQKKKTPIWHLNKHPINLAFN